MFIRNFNIIQVFEVLASYFPIDITFRSINYYIFNILLFNFADNPCYFCHDTKSPRTPDSQSSGKVFSIFTRRNSKGSSPRPLQGNPEQKRLITSANLDTTATMAFGSPRGSFNSLGGLSQVRTLPAPITHTNSSIKLEFIMSDLASFLLL